MKVKKISEEVFVSGDPLTIVNLQFIRNLKKAAGEAPGKRVRLNIHKNLSELIHEMFIVHIKDTYIRPHKHLHKNESLHILEGKADIVFFDEDGGIKKVIQMANYSSGKDFYYKLTKSWYHTLIVKSENLVFCETANGPYKKSDTIFAPWSPGEDDSIAVKNYMSKLADKVDNFLQRGSTSKEVEPPKAPKE